jgi:hypothetical protein
VERSFGKGGNAISGADFSGLSAMVQGPLGGPLTWVWVPRTMVLDSIKYYRSCTLVFCPFFTKHYFPGNSIYFVILS